MQVTAPKTSLEFEIHRGTLWAHVGRSDSHSPVGAIGLSDRATAAWAEESLSRGGADHKRGLKAPGERADHAAGCRDRATGMLAHVLGTFSAEDQERLAALMERLVAALDEGRCAD
jgi:hypothetical protein